MSSKRSRAAFESADPPQHAPFALYGTPLPAFDAEVRDDGSYVPVWKQEVTDEQGRKRLHGAFTGGYSAGYFNTVGSKEGWAPATFVSSRSNRAKDQQDGKAKKQSRPEDYMDEEDLAEQAEAQKLETQGAFAGFGTLSGDSGPKGMFSDMFKSTGDTMGVKLLQRMGWRPGQGVGPKVKRRAQGDKIGEMHLFAPENTRMISFHRKTDRKGIDFAGENSLDAIAGQKTWSDEDDGDTDARILSITRSRILAKPKKLKKSSMGIGVLNNTGSDDEDPYAIGPQINYSRIIGGDKKKRKGGLVTSSTVQRPAATSKKPAQPGKSRLDSFRRCHDGRLPLEGFILSVNPLVILLDTTWAPPAVPAGWRSSKRATKFDAEARTFESTADAAKTSVMDPTARAAALGEQSLPGKSVFDFMSKSGRDKLVSASGRADLPQARGESAPAGFEQTKDTRTLWDLVPPLDAQTATAALRRGQTGWMPYAEDEGKRERYRAFLSLRAGFESSLPTRPPGTSTDQWAKELNEFAQAAEVFKPISGLMATRFTTSTVAPRLASDVPEFAPAPPAKVLDPADEAAKAGLYGPLTRTRYAFYPTRLLCKRFNAKPPTNTGVDAQEAGAEAQGASDLVNKAELDRMMMHAAFKPTFASAKEEGGGRVDRATTEHARVDVETNDALEGPRPDEAAFKNVFEDE